jgi:signal transduction histidine kinase/CheY-like chemotaxis protein
VSALQTAIRARERQYQIRDQIEAIRNGQSERQLLLESERAARLEAERAGRIKDEFLATLSHELRTPLNAILGWAQIIKMGPENAETVSEGVQVIDRNVRIQTQLIEDLLDVSRIISGKVRLDVQRANLAEIIGAASESVLPALTAKEIQLEQVIDPTVGWLDGDPARLQQVLWNLLTNAAKFTPRGGKIRVLAERVHSHLEIRVTDSGEGIAPEFLPRLFERFAQADASTTRKHGGLGLGLSIVRSLVEMHGGTITAESQGIGQGATFIVHLPQRDARSSDQDAMRLSRSPSDRRVLNDPKKLNGLRILVVDDEQDARELVRRFLIDCGATPAIAASADEAKSLLPSFKPDVIISDIGMPNQDGFEFMRAVRTQGVKTPAVALTAFARPEDRIRSIEAGYQIHLPKPVEPAELIAVIANLAGRY